MNKKEIKIEPENSPNRVYNGLPAVIQNEIALQIYNFTACNYKEPDNIMIHFSLKEKLFEEITRLTNQDFSIYKNLKIFGVKVIFTDCIEVDEIICTINSR